MNHFHKRLKELRLMRGLTLDELARALKTTKTTLSRYENNKRIADSDFIVEAARFFCVSTDYVLGLTDNPLTVDDLLCMRRISLEDLSEEDVSTVYSIVEELKNKAELS